jgi:hypothetical protein
MNFESEWVSAQNEVPNETNEEKEMMFNVPFPGNKRRSVKNFDSSGISVLCKRKSMSDGPVEHDPNISLHIFHLCERPFTHNRRAFTEMKNVPFTVISQYVY